MSRAFVSFLGVVLLTSAAAAQQTGSAVGQAHGEAAKASDAAGVQENVPYGPGLLLDVYEPAKAGGNRPAVILIHGGDWTSFDKSTMKTMAQFMARSGFVAFAVDYRLFHENENRWPAQLDDGQWAVRWVRANADKYGVNPEKIGAFGHSVGAQVAALLGMEETRDNSDATLAKYSSRVQAVVDYSGPTDFTTERDPEGMAFLTNFFRVDYSEHPEVWRDASPAFHTRKSNAPFLIIHGIHDESVPIAQAQEFYDKLKAAGVPVSLRRIDEGHTVQKPESRRQLALESRDFFNQYLGSSR